MYKFFVTVIVVLLSAAASGQEAERGARTVIESGGRSVTFTDKVTREHTGYGSPWQYAHAIRAGDFVYISGVVIDAAIAIAVRKGPSRCVIVRFIVSSPGCSVSTVTEQPPREVPGA